MNLQEYTTILTNQLRGILITAVQFIICSAVLFSAEKTQTIRGVVIDADMGKPIPGATVKITTVSPNIGAVTSTNGLFKIENVPVGRHVVHVTSMSYKTKIIENILIITGKESYLQIKMIDAPVKMKTVKIKATNNFTEANNELATVSATVLQPEAINRFAGSRGDPAKMAATCAGVASNNTMRNDIIIRGNSPLGVLWRIEGADVPSPNHFMEAGAGGGIFGILNNNLLAASDFMTSAFPAEYGNKTAGAFDVKLRNGNNEKYEHTFQVGINGLEFGTEGPFSSGSRASYLANFRFVSLAPLEVLGMDMNYGAVPEYLDGTVKINIPTDEYGKITFFGIAGSSGLNAKDSEDEDIEWDEFSEEEDFLMRSRLYVAGLNHSYIFGEKTLGELIISTSGTIMKTMTDIVTMDSSRRDSKYEGTEGTHMIKYSLSHRLSSNHLFKAGLSLSNNFFDISYMDTDDDNVLTEKLNENGNANLIQSFMHWQFRPNDLWEFNTGLHYQLFTLNDSYSVEPRFSALFKVDDNQKISLGYGLHSQTHPLMHYFFKFEGPNGMQQSNRNLDLMKSHHLVLGYQNTMIKNLQIKAEAYVQYLYDVPVTSGSRKSYFSFSNIGGEFGMDIIDSLVNDGTGLNYGIDMTLNKRFNNGYYFMITGSIFKSLYTDYQGIERSTSFDLGHVLNVIGGAEFDLDKDKKYVFSVDLKLTSTGGRRIVPIDLDASIAAADKKRDLSKAYEYQLPNYFTADIKLGLNINLESTTHNIFIAVDNFTNHKNVLKQGWDDDKLEIDMDYQIGLLPYLGYRINF